MVREQARELLTVLEPFCDITLETLETLMASAADRDGALNLAERAKQLAHNLHGYVARRCSVLRCVSTALAASGHTDLARDLVADISGLPDIHAEALCAIADQLDHPDAEQLIAQAFGVGRWTIPLDSLARIQPDTITVLTEQQLRHRHAHAEAPISDLDTALILTGTEQVLPTVDGAAITLTRYTPFEPDTLPQWEVAIQFAEWRGELGDAAAAASAYAALLPDALRTIGFSDARTRRIWAGTAYWTAEAGDLAGGIRLFVQLYQECVNTLGQHDPESLATKRNIATLAANDGHYEAAAELFVELLDAYTQTLGPDHAETSAVRTTLNQLNRALEGKPDARP
ncbi:tetratricopeptide repeat protein [Nocardia vinacea]|uniref:tetratricopeptide repeat protein n=1 Tax=Nocardia vinacea TaxID=96468 RepID=UPI00343C3869